MEPVYTTREAVKSDMDIKETARANALVDRCIRSASRSLDGFLRRRFYPQYATRYFDWPNANRARTGRLWLDEHFLISFTEVTSGGVVVPDADVILYPDGGPSYDQLELNSSSTAAWTTDGTAQNSIGVTGLWGETDDHDPAGVLDGAVADAVTTAVTVTASSTIGVGSLLKVDTERMMVTERRMADTGETLTAGIAANKADQLLLGHDPTQFSEGDLIAVGAERMRVDAVQGTTIVVSRAWDGSPLAAHSVGASVYAPRLLTVARGAVGSTPTSHLDGATVSVWHVPDLIEEFCAAEALNAVAQKRASYARVSGSGDNERETSVRGLADVRDRALALYGRLLNG